MKRREAAKYSPEVFAGGERRPTSPLQLRDRERCACVCERERSPPHDESGERGGRGAGGTMKSDFCFLTKSLQSLSQRLLKVTMWEDFSDLYFHPSSLSSCFKKKDLKVPPFAKFHLPFPIFSSNNLRLYLVSELPGNKKSSSFITSACMTF